MLSLPRLSSLWRNLFHKSRVEQELSEELQAYLEMLIETKRKEGLSPEAARRAALLDMGGVEQVKEQVREVKMGHHLETLWRDAEYGLRVLLKNPGFTLIVLLTLAIGIGANTAIFSVVDAALLRPLAFREPGQLVKVWPQKLQTSVSKAEFVEIRDNNQSFDDLAAYSGWSFSLTGGDEPAKLRGARTTATFFSLLGMKAALGRTFLADEDQPGKNHVVMLGHGLWESRFGSNANIVGEAITIDGESYTIVGVLPTNFKFPDNHVADSPLDLIVPAPLDPASRDDFTAGYLNVVGRLHQGVTAEQAQAEVSAIAQNAREKLLRRLDSYGLNAVVMPLQEEIVSDTRSMLYLLLGAVLFVLLIACANVANLQLARTTARRREIAIRLAVGAGRGRVIRQLLTESILLSLLGGALGVLLAIWGSKFLVALLPADIPRINEIGIDFRVLSFSLGISILTGVIFGLAPALLSSKPDLQGTLKEGSKTSTSRAGDRLRRLLVVAEVSLALILVVGAGLLIKSFWQLLQVHPGFDAEQVLSMQIAPPATNYSKPARKRVFYHQVLERIAALPGVKAVGGIHLLPMGGNNWNPELRVEDDPQPPGAALPLVDWRLVTPDYFQAMGIPLLRGRFFTAEDNENAAKVAIINETLARRYWGDEDPIGRRISCGFDGKDWVPIVGVVGDVKEQKLETPTNLEMYRPYDQAPFPSALTLMVRGSVDNQTLATSIRDEIHAVEKDVPLADIQPLTQVVSQSTAARRSTMLMLVGFAAIALILGAVGIYGVMSYAVSQHTHEIGIRIALGAQVSDVLQLVIRQGMILVLIGVLLGLIGAYSLTRWIATLLYGVSPTDALTFAGVTLLLIAVALIACYIPSRRATKIDPMVALRYE